jgi:hypothetical protein
MFLHLPLPTSPFPLPLAAGLLTPAFLWAGAALVAVPILIHILNRRRYKVVPWAAMEYLLAAMKKNRRRLKFEQWILLAARCLVMLLLGLALARPLGCDRNSLAGLVGRRTGLSVFVIDNSYSMAYPANRPDAKTDLDQAKRLATQLIDRLSSGGESVAIITVAHPAANAIGRPTFNLDEAKAAIARIPQSYRDTDLTGALQQAMQIARDSREPNKNLYLLTDATRSAWEAVPAATATSAAAAPAPALRQLGPELAKLYHITNFNLGQKGQWNQAVLSLGPAANLVTTRFGVDFHARFAGYGAGPEPLVQWRVDDQLLPGGQSIKLQGEQDQTQPNAHLATGGPHVLSATLVSDNRLKLDDTRWHVVDVVSDLKVLLVEGDRGMGLMSGSAAFLQLALAPPTQDAVPTVPGRPVPGNSYISPEVISDLELPNKVLGDYRAVILTNVAQLSGAEARQLKTFVDGGGTLLWFMGEQVNAAAYNRTLLPLGLIPGALTKRMSVGGDQSGFLFDFRPNGPLHPYLNVFRGQEKSGLNTAQIFTYWQIDPAPALNVSRILNYLPPGVSADQPSTRPGAPDGATPDPAITVHSLGQGHIVFVTTSANADWTSFPAKPAYVTLMHELLDNSLSAADGWMNLAVGQRLRLPSTIKLTAAPALADPQLKELPLEQVTLPEGLNVYQSAPLERPGVYSLKTGSRTIPIAVNVPPDEADLRVLDDNALRQALGNIDLTLLADQLPPVVAQRPTGEDFGWAIMAALFGLVALECFMAMRFGHHRRKPA